MINMIDIGVDNAVSFRISGKITEADIALVIADAREKIEKHDQIVIFEQIDSFQGIEISAIIEEFRYLRANGLSNISKAVVITDKKWIEKIACIENNIFKNIEIQCFSHENITSAIKFITTRQRQPEGMVG